MEHGAKSRNQQEGGLFMFYKIILSMLLLLVPANAYAVRDFWTPTMANNWATAKALNNAQWQGVYNRRDLPSSSLDNDYGLLHAVYCRASNDNSYCTVAANRVGSTQGRDHSGWMLNDNGLRHNFTAMSIVYGIACAGNRGGTTACNNAKDSLNYMADMALNDHNAGPTFLPTMSMRIEDSDELIGKWFGTLLFAVAIQYDDPSRYSEIMNHQGYYSDYQASTLYTFGGFNISTPFIYENLRNQIYTFFNTLAKTGDWIESTPYNHGTLSYAFNAVRILHEVLGVDYFPEITNSAYYDSIIAWNRFTPNINQLFQWGDTEARTWVNDNSACAEHVSALAFNPTNKELCYMINARNCYSSYGSQYKYPYMNQSCQAQVPSGVTTATSERIGISYWHSGWGENDSFYGSLARPKTFADHDGKGWRNFNVWRYKNWALNSPKKRHDDYYEEANWMNMTRVHGSFPTSSSEAKQLHLFESGQNYHYSVAVAGGHQVRPWDPKPPESLHEFTTSLFYLHHANGADSVISFDRINSHNPLQLGNVNYYLGTASNNSDEGHLYQFNGKHIVQFFTKNAPTISGSRITWTAANNITSYWDTFITGFNSATDYGVETPESSGIVWIPADVREYRVRLTVQNNTTPHQTFGNIFHQGSNPTITQIISTGEAAKAYKIISGSETTVVVFNAADRTSDLPAPSGGSVYDYNRFDKIKSLHFFKQSFTLTIPTDSSTTEVFIVDLNPSAQWTYALNGGASQSLNESTAGLAKITLLGSGTYTLQVNNVGFQAPTCAEHWDYCPEGIKDDCEEAGWCFEDRGTGNDCYETCIVPEPEDCATSCAGCYTSEECLGSSASNCDGTGYCCWSTTQSLCDTVPEPDCDSRCDLCSSSDGGVECAASEAGCYFWSTDQCQSTPEPSCKDDPELCYTSPTCLANGWVWCNDDCLAEAPPASNLLENTSANCSGDDVTNLTCTANVTSCTNQVMLVALAIEETNTAPDSVVWKNVSGEATGQTLTLVESKEYWYGAGETYLYYLLDPDVGTGGQIIVTHPRASTDFALAMQTVCGLKQQAPEADAVNSSNANPDASVTSITDNAYIVSAASSITTINFTADSPLIKLLERDGLGQTVALGAYQAGTAGSKACNWTPSSWTEGGNVCAAFEVEVGESVCIEDGGGGGGSIVNRIHDGEQTMGMGGL